jgi:hypothetical protein
MTDNKEEWIAPTETTLFLNLASKRVSRPAKPSALHRRAEIHKLDSKRSGLMRYINGCNSVIRCGDFRNVKAKACRRVTAASDISESACESSKSSSKFTMADDIVPQGDEQHVSSNNPLKHYVE